MDWELLAPTFVEFAAISWIESCVMFERHSTSSLIGFGLIPPVLVTLETWPLLSKEVRRDLTVRIAGSLSKTIKFLFSTTNSAALVQSRFETPWKLVLRWCLAVNRNPNNRPLSFRQVGLFIFCGWQDQKKNREKDRRRDKQKDQITKLPEIANHLVSRTRAWDRADRQLCTNKCANLCKADQKSIDRDKWLSESRF